MGSVSCTKITRVEKEKMKPYKIVTTKYYEELDGKFPERVGQSGTAGRRIRQETTTEMRLSGWDSYGRGYSRKELLKSTCVEYL